MWSGKDLFSLLCKNLSDSKQTCGRLQKDSGVSCSVHETGQRKVLAVAIRLIPEMDWAASLLSVKIPQGMTPNNYQSNML